MNDRLVCASKLLQNGGAGFEFQVLWNDEVVPAFAIRFQDRVHAYINRCSHMELKLNFLHDDFFDLEKQNLICATHGALYEPATGNCLGGPCNGSGLVALPVIELDGFINLVNNSNYKIFTEEKNDGTRQ